MHSLLPAPALAELNAPPDWAVVDFISDLHLWAQSPRTAEAFAHYMTHSSADAIIVLGDLFEVWVGDDARHEPFEAHCAAVLKTAAASRFVGFMHGNRDFLVGAVMLQDSRVALLHDPTVLGIFGRRILLSHGDELCIDDVEYQHFRTLVRSTEWQQQFLARPLEERKQFVRKLRNDSEERKRSNPNRDDWVDLDRKAMLDWMSAASAPVFVHGHTHRPADEELAPGYTRHVLSDWDLDVAAPSRERSQVLRLTAAGFERLSIASAVTPQSSSG